MNKVLCIPDGNFLAHVTRPLEIAKCLRTMGYTVAFAGNGDYMRLPTEEGFEVIPLVTVDPKIVLDRARKGRLDIYNYDLLKEHISEETSLYKAYKPDLILGDYRMTLRTSCLLNNIPLVMIKNAMWTDYYSIKLRTPESSILTKLFGRKLVDPIIPYIANFIFSYDIRVFNKLHKELGLRRLNNIHNVIEGDINLLADLPDYAPTDHLPQDHIYIGPIVWEPTVAFPERLKSLDPNRPTIYFTMGSTGFPKFFERAKEIFGTSDYQCIVTTAGMVQLSSVPDNFYVFDYLPGSKVMEISDVVVCHGGNGTLYQALIAGTPIIGIPTFGDQEYNLDRIVSLGTGISLSETNFKPADLSNAVNEILRNDSYKINAVKYQNELRDYNGPQKGANMIEAFLSNAN